MLPYFMLVNLGTIYMCYTIPREDKKLTISLFLHYEEKKFILK